jgi:4-amino-4-deoxy-L-arabinose transferase-like glycosyltransferase
MGHALAIAIIVVFTLTVLGIFLGTGDPTNSMEMFNLVPVREAFRDGHWLVPTLSGWPRLEKPPLCVWIPGGLAALVGSDSLWVTRAPSVVMALLTALGTYGIGCLMFRRRGIALLAAVMLVGMFAFDRHARLASYDIYAAAFTVGCAYFLIRLAEKREGGWRAVLLTVLAGLALGLSLMAKGPAPAATVLIPLMVWLGIYHRRRGVWIAVGGMVVIGVVVFAPWVIAVATKHPEAWAFWKREFLKLSEARDPNAPAVTLDTIRPWYYYLQAFVWTVPFLPLFVAGLCLPFIRPRTEAQRGLLPGRWMAWIVTIGGFVLLSIPAVKEQRYAVQLLPFAALLCAAVIQELAEAGETESPAARLTLELQLAFFGLPALAAGWAGIWMLFAGQLPSWAGGAAMSSAVSAIGRVSVILLGLILIALVLWVHDSYKRRRLLGAGVAFILVAWFFAFGVNWMNRADPANHTNAFRPGVEQAVKIVGRSPAAIFRPEDIPPLLATAYYFDRAIPQLVPEWVVRLTTKNPTEPVYVLEWSPVEQKESWQLAAVEQLTKRKSERVMTFEAEGRRLTVTRLDVPTLLIDAGGR